MQSQIFFYKFRNCSVRNHTLQTYHPFVRDSYTWFADLIEKKFTFQKKNYSSHFSSQNFSVSQSLIPKSQSNRSILEQNLAGIENFHSKNFLQCFLISSHRWSHALKIPLKGKYFHKYFITLPEMIAKREENAERGVKTSAETWETDFFAYISVLVPEKFSKH